MKKGSRILIATNHTDSYFKKAKSNWIEYLSEPNPSKKSQEVILKFNNHKNQKIFSGKCFFHQPKLVIELLEKAGFTVIKQYETLASKEDRYNFPKMWIDEDKIPFHLIILAKK
jgi:hypothetical protein